MTRILVFGTFDMVHEGHRDLFCQARALAIDPYLIVSLARDRVVKKIKGKLPRHTEKERAAALQQEKGINEVVLGSESDYIAHIKELKPDVIALGYDQSGIYVEGLAEKLAAAGMRPQLIRLKSFKPEHYKSSRLNDS